MHHSTRYARESNAAFELGLKALFDKSKHVQHLACLLLSWSLRRKDALVHLRKAEASCDDEVLEDTRAAIDAVESQNSNYFADRDHSGQVTLNVV